MCISSICPGDADAAGQGPHLRVTDPDYKFHESRDHVGLVQQNEWHIVAVKSILVY